MATHSSSRPAYLTGASISLVFVGGLLGVAAREGFMLAVPNRDNIPIVVPIVNLLGAFILGYLYEALTRVSPSADLTSRLKLLIGTGFCGGLTPYRTHATETDVLFGDSRDGLGEQYAVGTVVVGAGFTFAGIALASTLHERKSQGTGAGS